MNFAELEKKDFNLKFSFENLTTTFLYLQKILEIYPDENCPSHKCCIDLWHSILEQLSHEEGKALETYFNAMHLEQSLEEDEE
tara:strand:+ start:751 stop:999 length:249 start_codon:yes stop_codon:yes gene_type:complete